MASLPVDVRASYVVIIDGILENSDLQAITSKQIREGLQRKVDYDITPQKNEIKQLIMERFDKFAAERNAIPTTNGHAKTGAEPPVEEQKTGMKRPHNDREDLEDDAEDKVKIVGEEEEEEEAQVEEEENSLSDAPASSPPKKKRKAEIDEDAAYAARLQAEENSRARPTRGGTQRKPPAAKKKSKAPRKKTSSKVNADDDSDLDGGSGTERKVNRNTGFHKPLALSAPLSQLLDGVTQMSRPQTVKRIWEYVKARNLQDPKDKRIIRCDDALRAVFKQDKVHMFTMNKILATQMYDPDG